MVAVLIAFFIILIFIREYNPTFYLMRTRYRFSNEVDLVGTEYFGLLTNILKLVSDSMGKDAVSNDECTAMVAESAAKIKAMAEVASRHRNNLNWVPVIWRPELGMELLQNMGSMCDKVIESLGGESAREWLDKACIDLMKIKLSNRPGGEDQRRILRGYLNEAQTSLGRAIKLDPAAQDEAANSNLLRHLLIKGRPEIVVKRDALLTLKCAVQCLALFTAGLAFITSSVWWLLGTAPFCLLGGRKEVKQTIVVLAVGYVIFMLTGLWFLGVAPPGLYGALLLWAGIEARGFICPVCGGFSTAIRFDDTNVCDFCGTN